MSAFTLLKYHHNQTLWASYTYCSISVAHMYHRELCNTSTFMRCQNAKFTNYLEEGGVQCIMKIYTRNRHVYSEDLHLDCDADNTSALVAKKTTIF